jgi:hypothetical protein
MLDTIKTAFATGLRHWKIVLLVYFLQLLTAVPLAMQVWHVLEASIGNSLEINKLLSGYDHTVFSDFLKVHGGSITPLIGQLRWVLVIWAIASVFTNGGLLFTLVKRSPTWLSFWTGGALYFFRFAKIAILFMLFVMTWSGVVLLPFLAKLQINLETMASEKTVVASFFGLLVIWFLGMIYLYCASIIAKTAIIELDAKTWQAVRKGFRTSLRYFGQLAGIFLVFSILQLVALAIYWLLEGKSGMINPVLILVFFVLQQFLVFWRIMGRVMCMDGISNFTQKIGASSA